MKKILLTVSAVFLLCTVGIVGAQTRSNKTDIARNLNIFNSLFKELQINYVDTIDANRLMRTAIDAMLAQIDPYTEYFPADDQDELMSITTGQFGGIGSIISKRGDSVVIINQPQYDSPARRYGLRHGDIILAIDGTPVTRDMNIGDVSARLRGRPGTKVEVKLRRPWVGADSIIDVTIVRESIKTDPVPYYAVLDDGVGYIRLTTFNEHSAGKVKDALVTMKRDPRLKGVVLDLRGNGGGLLESAVQIAGLFVPKGTEIVRTRGFDAKKEKIYKTTQQPVDTDIPLAVLTDGGTASSSEIVAGSLQDYDRAVIIGERSYGKGLVQIPRPLPYDGILKVTVSRYYIPSGRLIQAIDYSHRNPDGSPARIPDSLTNVYHTRAGRIVRDGGGITPDVVNKGEAMSRLIYNIYNDMWAYDYANRFVARDNGVVPDPDTFTVTDSIYRDFKAFIDPARFHYDRVSESGIDYLRKAAEREGYMNDSVAAQIDRLAAMLKHDLDSDLDLHRNEIIEILDDEISDRYFSDADKVRRSLQGDIDLDSARAIILAPARYKAILTPATK